MVKCEHGNCKGMATHRVIMAKDFKKNGLYCKDHACNIAELAADVVLPIKPIEELNALLPLLPGIAAEDIKHRVKDWLESGGGIEAPYITQQLQYAKRVFDREKLRK